MKCSVALLAALSFGLSAAQTSTAASGVQRPTAVPRPGAITSHGCYNMSSTTWKKYPVENISIGSCTEECQIKQQKNVAAANGEDCYCGDTYPPGSSLTDDKFCNFPCPFYPEEACGGVDDGFMRYSVFNTGLKLVVANDQVSSTSTSVASKPTTTTANSVQTVIETPVESTSAPADPDEKKGGPNVAGIAAGVVVGVVVVAAIAGGAFYFYRRKRNQEIEEEHRRNAAVNAFIGGAKPPSSSGVSMSDSRMDPTLAHRRMSDGSIADNQDYSRKILRVTNA
ncbi:Cell wall integrity and stress response component 1 [Colletotrichum chlorophyti]|uniref:Cell wall integrity and stress response component 1 n=1 Tax=Colletotrichum chlorophyti TaxID=708187 RepID=A0A1Q8S3V2_9PEZI|nr:Cell wall integrity and stress response component 1 [Colletotrichum chlorophyti]